MFRHTKQLAYKVRVEEPNPVDGCARGAEGQADGGFLRKANDAVTP